MATHLHLKARFLVAFAVRTLEVVGSRVFSKVLSNCICHSDATAVERNEKAREETRTLLKQTLRTATNASLASQDLDSFCRSCFYCC